MLSNTMLFFKAHAKTTLILCILLSLAFLIDVKLRLVLPAANTALKPITEVYVAPMPAKALLTDNMQAWLAATRPVEEIPQVAQPSTQLSDLVTLGELQIKPLAVFIAQKKQHASVYLAEQINTEIVFHSLALYDQLGGYQLTAIAPNQLEFTAQSDNSKVLLRVFPKHLSAQAEKLSNE